MHVTNVIVLQLKLLHGQFVEKGFFKLFIPVNSYYKQYILFTNPLLNYSFSFQQKKKERQETRTKTLQMSLIDVIL